MTPDDLPPWEAVNQLIQCWLRARVLEAFGDDLRMLWRWVVERRFGWAARFRCLAHGYERLP